MSQFVESETDVKVLILKQKCDDLLRIIKGMARTSDSLIRKIVEVQVEIECLEITRNIKI